MMYSPEKITERYKEFINHGIKPEKALYLVRIMFEFTARGFERYISAYFHKIEGYYTKAIGGVLDKGIDIEGWKKFGHHMISLAIQCKKWTRFHIKKREILNFEYDLKHRDKNGPHTQNAFVTTNWASKEAKLIAEKHNINVIDCYGVLKFQKEYDIDKFKNEFMQGEKYRSTKLFTNIDVINIIKQKKK